jgi:hypothetical protein
MSRTSTLTTKTSSSSRFDPSPTVSVPSLAHETTYVSQDIMASFSALNAIDDFVLFPEDTASWNPADMTISEDADLSNFDFDINGIDLDEFTPMNADQSYDFSRLDPTPSFDFDNSFTYSPSMQDQYGLDQWASPVDYSMPVSHSRPHHASLSQDPRQLDSNPLIADSPGSVQSTTSMFADGYWPGGSVDQLQHAHGSRVNSSPMPSSAPDWGLLDSGLDANISDLAEMTSSAGSSQLRTSRKERCKRKRPLVDNERQQNVSEGARQLSQAQSIQTGDAQGGADSSDIQRSLGSLQQSILSNSPIVRCFDTSKSHSAQDSRSSESVDIFVFADTCALVSESIRAFKSAPAEYMSLANELQRLRTLLDLVKTGNLDGTPLVLSEDVRTQLKTLVSQLEILSSRVKQMLRTGHIAYRRYKRLDPEIRPEFVRQCQVKVRRLIRSLCATTNNLQAQSQYSRTTSDCNPGALPSGRNTQLVVSTAESHTLDGRRAAESGSVLLDLSPHNWQNSNGSSSSSSALIRDIPYGDVLLEADGTDVFQFADDLCESNPPAGSQLASGTSTLVSVRVPRYNLVIKPTEQSLERLSPSMEAHTAQAEDRGLSDDVQYEPSFSETIPFFSGARGWCSGREYICKDTIRDNYQPNPTIHEQRIARPGVHVEQVDVRRAISPPHPDPYHLPFDPAFLQGPHETWATANLTTSSLAAMASQHVGSTEETPLATSVELFRGAIPRTAVDCQSSCSTMDQQHQQETFARISATQNYSLHVVLSAMASLALLMVRRPPSTHSNFFPGRDADVKQTPCFAMPILIFFLALPTFCWLAHSRQGSTTPSNLMAIAVATSVVPLLVTFSVPLILAFTALQGTCTQWIDNSTSPFATLAKLSLCCILASIPPSKLAGMFSSSLTTVESLAALAMISLWTASAGCKGLRGESVCPPCCHSYSHF